MSAKMTKRERVERTMAHQETDRVPLYDLLRNDAAFEHYSGETLPGLSGDEHTVAELNRIAGKAVGRYLDMTRSVGFGPVESKATTDRYGIRHRSAPFEKTSWITSRPFSDEAGATQFLKTWIADTEAETRRIVADPAAYRENCHKTYRQTQALIGDTVNLLAQHGTGLDNVRHQLGMDLYSYLEADDPGLISEALEAATLSNIAICHAVADRELSPCVLTYTDIAYKDRLIHSPEFLRREVIPRVARMNDAWHEHGIKCLFHSDGYLMDVLDDLVDAGIDGLNPIETVAGMCLKEVKEKYGDRLFLAGGIDMSQLLSNAEPDEVREVCRQAVRDAYPGYFMGSTTESDNSCKLENLIAMYEVAMEGV